MSHNKMSYKGKTIADKTMPKGGNKTKRKRQTRLQKKRK